MLEQKETGYIFEKGNPCEQWSDGGFSAVENLSIFHLDERMFWQYTDKNQKFYSGIREVDSAVEKNTGVFLYDRTE